MPVVSVSTVLGVVVLNSPNFLAHIKAPDALSFWMYILGLFDFDIRFETPVPGSKSTVSTKVPMLKTDPASSSATQTARPVFLPPKLLAQINVPEEDSFIT